ncbi:MAG TPA: winged helix-turn-helix domain-containing protein [Thermoplasmata archaeon]|nr:winged helix-turn-helix domain-containing protein [Thermoplasmata archaeon]
MADTGRRREQSDLFATILEVVKRYHGEGRITRISYGAGMPVDRLRSSVDRLVALGLLKRTDRGDHLTFDITPRGQEFLNVYWKLRGFTEEFEHPPGEYRP